MSIFKLKSEYAPAGDQPQAIDALVKGIEEHKQYQTLLGVTGSGKTFTIANVIEQIGKPTLVIAHNKTLAAQLAQEYKSFFPDNAVHYFVSYYDYYQPEAYVPTSDTYIEKEAQINAEIERLRHASTQALLSRKDVIIVASVSCIYGLGSPEEYEKVHIKLQTGMKESRASLIRRLVHIYFERTTSDISPGLFRATGNRLEVMPVNEKVLYRIDFNSEYITNIGIFDAVSYAHIKDVDALFLFPAKHFVTPESERARAIKDIKDELKGQLARLLREGKMLEAERLKRRTNYDLSLIKEIGYCNGIENYSRHFDGRTVGKPPHTLLSYFPHTKDGKPDFLTVIDESHVTLPQLGGMFAGDKARKETLVAHGFRLPSALDNRPLDFAEFEERIGTCLYTSATPGPYERAVSETIAEQVIRPTGLLDPEIEIRPIADDGTYPGQVKDFIQEAQKEVGNGHRVIATTLSKRMAEDVSEYLREKGMKAEYLHSEIDTLERIEILTKFRRGEFDVLVGVNLLREGLDLPEVSFIGIFDADKRGFLRSETSLIQIIGRAARNILGHVILYAEEITPAMTYAIEETRRRRKLQIAYNKKHGITPKTIIKQIKDIVEDMRSEHSATVNRLLAIDKELLTKNPKVVLKEKKAQMEEAVQALDFETAVIIRDEIKELNSIAEKEQTSRKKKVAKKK